MRLVSRLDKIAATLAAKQPARQEIWKCIMGVEDKEVALDRMIADGDEAGRQCKACWPAQCAHW